MQTDKKNGELTFSEKCRKLGNVLVGLALIDTVKKNTFDFALVGILTFQLELYQSDEMIEEEFIEIQKELSSSIPGESRLAELENQIAIVKKNGKMTLGEKVNCLTNSAIAFALIETFDKNSPNLELTRALAFQFEPTEGDEMLKEFLDHLHFIVNSRLQGYSVEEQNLINLRVLQILRNVQNQTQYNFSHKGE